MEWKQKGDWLKDLVETDVSAILTGFFFSP